MIVPTRHFTFRSLHLLQIVMGFTFAIVDIILNNYAIGTKNWCTILCNGVHQNTYGLLNDYVVYITSGSCA